MGAPNVVRGGSHVGFPSVAEAAAAGVVDALCSDYHVASLFHAPFLLDEAGVVPLAEGWTMVSTRPASAVGLADRGRVETGACADLLFVDRGRDGVESLRAVCRAGRPVAIYR
jgi:alpha-D-ribose 1-methylphosphonate 5-triphosphate diphosphatase